MARGTKITVDLGGEDILKAMEIVAIEQGKSVEEIVLEALREWLKRKETLEDEEDLKAMREAEEEYRETGGRPFEEVVRDLGLGKAILRGCFIDPANASITLYYKHPMNSGANYAT